MLLAECAKSRRTVATSSVLVETGAVKRGALGVGGVSA